MSNYWLYETKVRELEERVLRLEKLLEIYKKEIDNYVDGKKRLDSIYS